MSFFNFEILKEKLKKFIWTMPQVKLSKTMFLKFFLKNKQSFQLIWTYKNMVQF
jgi:hypothetical protein